MSIEILGTRNATPGSLVAFGLAGSGRYEIAPADMTNIRASLVALAHATLTDESGTNSDAHGLLLFLADALDVPEALRYVAAAREGPEGRRYV